MNPRRGGAAKRLALALFCLAAALPVQGARVVDRQPLFRIERNEDRNVVQYDAQVGLDGRLDPETPVDAYWVKVEKGGVRKELKWIERQLAYGFDASYDEADDVARLDMAADIGRQITVRAIEGRYRAEMPISGRTSLLDRVYVEARDTKPLPTVVHLDLHGTDVATGEPLFERLRP